MRIDLHTHSTVSDGTQTPSELVATAAGRGPAWALADGPLDVLALTDHDTTAGWDEAARAAVEHGITLVRGTEVSARSGAVNVHLLSYLQDPDEPALVELFTRVRVSRETRAQRMVDLLSVDFPITWGGVLEQTAVGTTIGRPHLADALVAAGVFGHRDEAFAQVLGPRSRYYVHHEVPDAVDAVRAIRAAGGVPVFAHPGAQMRGRIVSDAVVEELVAAGLAGLEVGHRDHDPAQRERLSRLATRLGLFMTGSSDYHGTGKTNLLGENTTAREVFEEIERRGRSAVVRP